MFNKTENSKPKTHLRGQAAMEYLMTYGWAILVIVIVLAILAFFLPNLISVPQTCQFSQAGFDCSENPAVISNSSKNGQVEASFNLQNGKGQTIDVKAVLCTTASLADADLTFATKITDATEQSLAAGATKQYRGISCVDEAGLPIVMVPNTDFRGRIVIYYNFRNDVTTILRPADAVLTGTVLGG